MPGSIASATQRGRWLYGGTIFVAAFLLFLVQPLIGRAILPWYGGAPSVWMTCLLFFQALLLLGYGYAHLSVRLLPTRMQLAVHAALLVAVWWVSILPDATWKPQGSEAPLQRILTMLCVTVGPAYFALAATAPLLQSWFFRREPGRTPYRLYALSNAGSLIALGSYPVLVEPLLDIDRQAAIWSTVFALFVPACLVCGWLARQGEPDVAADRATAERRMPLQVGRWVAWSASGVILFMAVTNQLALDIASVPFLWIVPLGLYLVSFIVAFSGRFYSRRWMRPLWLLALVTLYFAIQGRVGFGDWIVHEWTVLQRALLYAAALFIGCLTCHAELYRTRPEPRRLTGFYLWVALGGVLGGATVALAAPSFFRMSQELHLGMLACSALLGFAWASEGGEGQRRRRWLISTVLLVGLALALFDQSARLVQNAVYTQRNFFGLLRVHESKSGEPEEHRRSLYHGSVLHGTQFLHPQRQWAPTTYYTPMGGGGALLLRHRQGLGRRVGLIGLGVGTLATYGEAGDTFRFYEIDPDIVRVAQDRFTFLDNSRADCETVVGDARLQLEREADQRFDILVLDAFSSDAVPVHLLTLEAFRLYRRHLQPDGVLAIHISNQSLDLTPVVYNAAEALEMHALHVAAPGGGEGSALRRSNWMILSSDAAPIEGLVTYFAELETRYPARLYRGDPAKYREIRPWTDRYSNLLGILK